MEKLKKYLTPKATGWLAIGMGGGALLCWIALGIVYGSIKSYFTSFGANEKGLGLMVILLLVLMVAFFISLLATLVSGAGNGIRLFAWKDRRPFTIAAFAVACLNLLFLCFNFRVIGFCFSLFSGNVYGALGSGASLITTLSLRLGLLQFGMFLQIALAGYQVFLMVWAKKHPAAAQVSSAVGEVPAAAAAGAVAGAPVPPQGGYTVPQGGYAPAPQAPKGEGMKKFKEFAKSKAGKLTFIGVAAALVLLIGGGIALSILTQTRLDLVSNVEYTLEGESGDAYILLDRANVDYDYNDSDVANFVSSVSYQFEPSDGLKNGDKVVVRAVYSKETAKRMHIKIKEDVREIEITGLTERYDSAASIPAETVSAAKTQAEALLSSKKSSILSSAYGFSYKKDKTIAGQKLVGSYFVHDEPGSYSDDEIVLVYAVTVKGQQQTSYYPEEEFEDIEKVYYYMVKVGPINDQFSATDASVSGSNISYRVESDQEVAAYVKSNFSGYDKVEALPVQ